MRVSTEAALTARRRSTEAALGRVRDAIARLRREKTQVSVAAVSRRADVSRTFLYGNPDARAAVAAAIAQAGEQRTRILDGQDDEREATWRERALNAEDALKAAHNEILEQGTLPHGYDDYPSVTMPGAKLTRPHRSRACPLRQRARPAGPGGIRAGLRRRQTRRSARRAPRRRREPGDVLTGRR
jgi:hypothetical protein